MTTPLQPHHRESIAQALANLDEVNEAVGQEILEGCKAVKPLAKAYELLNSLMNDKQEDRS